MTSVKYCISLAGAFSWSPWIRTVFVVLYIHSILLLLELLELCHNHCITLCLKCEKISCVILMCVRNRRKLWKTFGWTWWLSEAKYSQTGGVIFLPGVNQPFGADFIKNRPLFYDVALWASNFLCTTTTSNFHRELIPRSK